MSDDAKVPLPVPDFTVRMPDGSAIDMWAKDAFRAVERAARAAEREACAREVAKTRHDLSLDPGVNGYFRSRYMPLVLRRLDALERAIRARAEGQSNG